MTMSYKESTQKQDSNQLNITNEFDSQSPLNELEKHQSFRKLSLSSEPFKPLTTATSNLVMADNNNATTSLSAGHFPATPIKTISDMTQFSEEFLQLNSLEDLKEGHAFSSSTDHDNDNKFDIKKCYDNNEENENEELGNSNNDNSKEKETNSKKNMNSPNINPPSKNKTTKESSNIPLCVLNNDAFYSSDKFKPRSFNAWSKKNGFYKPYHSLFIIKVIVWILLIVGCFSLVIRFLSSTPYIIPILIFSILLFLVHFVSTIFTMAIDTTDTNVIQANQPRNIEYVKSPGIPVIDPDTQECGICKVRVGEMTKHCKACNKCVDHFDHHCVFLSTCIGKKNYIAFCIMIMTITFASLFFTAITAWCISIYFNDSEKFGEKVMEIFNLTEPSSSHQKTAIILLFMFMLGTVTIAVTILHLTLFHVRLWILDMTTIEFLEARWDSQKDRSVRRTIKKKLRGWRKRKHKKEDQHRLRV